MEVRLAPHEQLELLDAWLREHPEVATEVKALDDIAKGWSPTRGLQTSKMAIGSVERATSTTLETVWSVGGVVHLHQQKKGTKVGEILKLKDQISYRSMTGGPISESGVEADKKCHGWWLNRQPATYMLQNYRASSAKPRKTIMVAV